MSTAKTTLDQQFESIQYDLKIICKEFEVLAENNALSLDDYRNICNKMFGRLKISNQKINTLQNNVTLTLHNLSRVHDEQK